MVYKQENLELFKEYKKDRVIKKPLRQALNELYIINKPVFEALNIDISKVPVTTYEIPFFEDSATKKIISIKQFFKLANKGTDIDGIEGFTFPAMHNIPTTVALNMEQFPDMLNMIQAYGHEVGHTTQKYGIRPIPLDIINLAKTKLNTMVGRNLFRDVQALIKPIEENVAYCFDIKFAEEFKNQYGYTMPKRELHKFELPMSLKEFTKRSGFSRDYRVLSQFLGKDFTPLETKPEYKISMHENDENIFKI